MFKKRGTLLNINYSLESIYKVRASRFLYPLRLLHNLKTAAERPDFQYEETSSSQSHHHYQNPSSFQGNFDHRNQNLNQFQLNSNGFYQNSSGVFGRNPGTNFPQNPVGENGNLNGNLEQKPDRYYSGNAFNNERVGSIDQNASRVFGKNPNSNFQENPANLNGSYGSYQNNHGQMQHYTNGAVGNSVHIQQSLDGVNGSVGNSMHFQQNPNGFLSQNENARNQFVTHGNGIQEIRPTGSQQPSFLGYRYQQSPSGYHGEYVGGNQQSANGHYGGNIGVSQPNQNGYGRETTVHYPQKSSNDFDYIAGQIVQRSNQFQNNSFSSQVPGGSSGTSVETAEDNQFRGTVEELEGLCKEGKVKEAIEVLTLLEKQQIVVDLPLYLQLIQACGEAKALQEAKAVHEHLVQSGMPLKVSIYNKVLDMYGKCGSMDDAYALFKSMPGRNLTSWDTMITWLAKNGLGEDALDLFMEFKKAGLKPDAQMFIGVFSACGVEGDITEGLLHFESMSKEYGILPSMEHYVSIVHMMGSAGYIDEALEFIEKMPAEPTVDVWETLMNLCRVHGDVELGDRCAELVELMDPSRLSEKSKQGLIPAKASDLAKEKEKKKMAGQNLLEVRSRVHEYRAGDTSHPEKEKIYAQLRRLKEQMKEAGYIPETRFVLHDIDQEGKEEALLAHSERLAASYGLLSSPVRSPIRVIKNLRVCGDCHSALKIISKLTGRELIMRDAKRFHHFKDGVCSCRDYW